MDIKKDIEKNGLKFFEKLKATIVEIGTKPIPYNETEHNKNKEKLTKRIEQLCLQSKFDPNISTDDLWKKMYERIFYAGTKSDKATKEIASIEKFGVFDDFRDLVKPEWDFEKKEWDNFSSNWKVETKSKTNWLNLAKKSQKWDSSINKHFVKTGRKTINLMTKQDEFNGIKFSSLTHKVEKYILIARFLNVFEKSSPSIPILEIFTGSDYNFKKEKFWQIHRDFSKLTGEITALHLMMDLGFDTIKPDRVITHLFAKLGWLEGIPNNSTENDITKIFRKKKIYTDVIEKALYLSRQLEEKYSYPTRQVDIWFVKYGQEPEEDFGITQNTNKIFPIEKLYKGLN